MAIEDAISAAVSGLRANAERVQVAADNIVNVSTPGYAPSEVVTTSVVTRDASSFAGTGGGVRTHIVPGNPMPPALQDVETVDLGLELTRLNEAHTAYNLAADLIRTSEEMLREGFSREV